MRIAGLSDVGRVRANNEDALDWNETAGVAVVADGMGGHPAGEVASTLAVRAVMERVGRESGTGRWLAAGGDPQLALETANAAILADAERHPRRRGMGTTAVVLACDDSHCRLAHVGDSRVYRLRDGVLEQLTRDHTAAQQAVEQQLISPDQARLSPERHQLTRALGLEPSVPVDTHSLPLEHGDLFLLCTDGLTEMVEDDTLRSLLLEERRDPERAARVLVRIALARGGHDNVTVALVAA